MRRLSTESFAGVFWTQQNLEDSDMPERAHDKHGGFIILVCVFIAADSIVKGKEAHVALCIESQYDVKERWGRFRRPGS